MFDVGIRVLYISPKETFDTPFGIGGNISSWNQFNSESWNGFKSNGKKWYQSFAGYPWEDYKNMRRNRFGRLALMAYKRRSFFYTPFKTKPIVLNTEELATIYHFPGFDGCRDAGLEQDSFKESDGTGKSTGLIVVLSFPRALRSFDQREKRRRAKAGIQDYT